MDQFFGFHHRFHRRTPSNPTSPHPDQLSPWEAAVLHAEHPQTVQDVSPLPDHRPRASNAANTPPKLPPIPRITSVESDGIPESRDSDKVPVPVPVPAPTPAPASVPTPPLDSAQPSAPVRHPTMTTRKSAYIDDGSGFIGGAALQNYRRGIQQGRSDGAGTAAGALPSSSHLSRPKPPPPPINTNIVTAQSPVPVRELKSTLSFIAPTELQASSAMKGKRPAGARLATDPPALTAPIGPPEAHKNKKGLPFLKNPVSTLLMRRRLGQNTPDLVPLPSTRNDLEPFKDPRIYGVGVHDFSAPRPRIKAPKIDSSASSLTKVASTSDLDKAQLSPGFMRDTSSHGTPSKTTLSVRTGSSVGTQVLDEPSRRFSDAVLTEQNQVTWDQKPLPEGPPPPVPQKDESSLVEVAPPKQPRRISIDTSAAPLRASTSSQTSQSRNASLSARSSRRVAASALPKHMKSTSSRFSFDMIGAAKQEKILEERHRQRALERQNEPESMQRDSRFDDFDDDSFDYDAMMDDDGLEEKIPGVNADLEEEDDFFDEASALDPDNDQENFAGFVFQRSNPESSIASPRTPGMGSTPHDPDPFVEPADSASVAGDMDNPNGIPSESSSVYEDDDPTIQPRLDDSMAGLGIQGVTTSRQVPVILQGTPPQPGPDGQAANVPRSTAPVSSDDLYFDEGLIDELNFGDVPGGDRFDESLFDLNDTDKFGRPIPGAFAQAQSMRTGVKDATVKRESDITSRLSAQSLMSQSTAHTSLSVEPPNDGKPAAVETSIEEQIISLEQQLPAQPPAQISDRDAAYQAALAAAAQQAAESGKFRRDSSTPPPPAELSITSPTTGSDDPLSGDHSRLDSSLDDYEKDDGFDYGIDDDDDDDDFDYESFVAEANAEVLANDAEGFYGREFGFYSAPIPGRAHGHANLTSSTTSRSHPAPLNAQNLYQYSNGGYFGPSGVTRSTSGHVVSREPNLTPITERSEYSNRNSIMSLALPPPIGSGGGGSGGVQSPGLAQLIMENRDDDEHMSLEALQRLRSKAWGGSQVSLARTSSPDGNSPRGGDFAVPDAVGGHVRKNSAFSIKSRDWDSDAGSAAGGSPTLTLNIPQHPTGGSPAPPAISQFTLPTAGGNVTHPHPQQQQQQQQQMPPPPIQTTGFPPVPEIDEEEDEDELEYCRPAPLSIPPSATAQTQSARPVSGSIEGLFSSSVWMTSPVVGESSMGLMSPVNNAAQAPASSPAFASPIVPAAENNPPTATHFAHLVTSTAMAAGGSGGSTSSANTTASSAAGGQQQQQQQRRSVYGHRHKGSADSISYVKEEDAGETRWVLERRRTDETGEVEILGREVVEGGRI